MRRRDLLAGLGGLATFAAAGWYALEGDVGGRSSPGPSRPSGPAATAGQGGGDGPDAERSAAAIRSVTVETLETAHSAAGRLTVPAPDEVTVVDLFATWCAGCDEQLRRLAAAHERVGGDVTFVSVTNQAIGGGFTRQDLRSFWNDHAGRWPVGLDDEGALTTRLGVRGLPHTAVTDPGGRLVFQEQGVTTADAVVEAVDRAAGP